VHELLTSFKDSSYFMQLPGLFCNYQRPHGRESV
jgi:hypothetical protein